MKSSTHHTGAASLCLLLGLSAGSRAQDLVITELMAANETVLTDEDGDDSDWIEVYNAGTTSANLSGWCLTDDAANPTKWRFPSVSLPADNFIVVFASGKDRRDPAGTLHTGFKLDAAGGYLALVKPDGVTVVYEYAPYPPQIEDMSYGLKQEATLTNLVVSGAAAKALVPQDGSLGTTWTQVSFSDSGWLSGSTGLGYDRNPDYTSLIELDVRSQMDGVATTAYLRVPFSVTDPSQYTGLFLHTKYDDGYIAYLNGTKVAERNAPAAPAWSSAATAQHDDALAVIFEEVNISSEVGRLRSGQNVLAVHGLNANATSSDFLVLPELDASASGTLDRSTRHFFTKPTPRLGNLAGYPGVSTRPQFSKSSGMITASFSLTLTSPTPGAAIRYTTNGSEPTEASTLYSAPISIAGTTMVRAKAFEAGFAPSPTVVQSYLMLATNVRTFTSNLPVLVVETFGQGINDAVWTSSFSAMLEPGATGRTSMTGTPTFTGTTAIKKRGSSSLGFPKNNYAFEVRDALGSDMDVSFLGMPEDSDWILHGPYSDKTLMRNHLSYTWSNRIGRWATHTKFVEMYLNSGGGNIDSGDYIGVYVFMEKIKRGDDRVDIKNLDASDSAEPDITGGYILKKDRLDPGDGGMTTSQGHRLGYVDPKEEFITPAQRAWIKAYLDEFESVLYGTNFKDPVNGYAKYIDVDSFIDHHILVEVTKNIDGFRLSTFMYKDRGGKLNMGPIWDYNLSLGNADYLQGWIATGFYYPQLSAGDYPWYGRLFQDPEFVQKYRDRWTVLRRGPFQTSILLNDIDEAAVLLDESQQRNFQRWRTLGTRVWPNWYIGQTYQDELNFMTDWVQDRLVWWDGLYPVAPSFTRNGGPIAPGFNLAISAPAGTIFYTLDGRDPRAPGGAMGPTAAQYSGAIVLDENTRVIARARISTSNWSGPTDATFVVATPPLVVSEIMYHPVNPLPDSTYGSQDFEFIELQNVGSQPLDLEGFRLSGSVSFVFGPGTALAPGGYVVLVKDPAAFELLYGTAGILVAGAYDGNLSNAGEEIVLEGPFKEPILAFAYDDLWYPETDGLGMSLTIVDPGAELSSWGLKESWRTSNFEGGSPGSDDGAPNSGGLQLPGDSNQDGVLDVSDGLSLLLRLFLGASKPLPCEGTSVTDGGNKTILDLNGDESVNVSDAVYLLNFLFRGGPVPSRGTSCVRVQGCPTACR
ncbi:MAG: CotH kinase family protein [Planctomycetes bacterium]|nr:CotH kinase family protein [Planctomycetota bacterium]